MSSPTFGLLGPSGQTIGSGTTTFNFNVLSDTHDVVFFILSSSATSGDSNFRTLSSLTSGTLTWTKLAGLSQTGISGGGLNIEVWWANCSGQTGLISSTGTLNATVNNTTSSAGYSVFSLDNVATPATPFDPNGALPNLITTASGSSSGSITTTNPADLLLFFKGGVSSGGTPSGWTPIGGVAPSLQGPGCVGTAYYKSVNAAQSGLAVTDGQTGGHMYISSAVSGLVTEDLSKMVTYEVLTRTDQEVSKLVTYMVLQGPTKTNYFFAGD